MDSVIDYNETCSESLGNDGKNSSWCINCKSRSSKCFMLYLQARSQEGSNYGVIYGESADDPSQSGSYCLMYNPKFRVIPEDREDAVSQTLGVFRKRLWALKSGSSWIFKLQHCVKLSSLSVWVRYLVWNFKGNLWNSTQNILPILKDLISIHSWNFKSC